jgi:hypothetical protein
MKLFSYYFIFLLVGLPLIMTIVHMANLPAEAKLELTETAKTLNGRIYSVRIDCNTGGDDHIVRIHGRSKEEARHKIQDQVERCDVEVLETVSGPIWKEVLRSVF